MVTSGADSERRWGKERSVNDFLWERGLDLTGEWGTLPPADGKGTEILVWGDTREGDVSGIARELADARDLMSPASRTDGGSGDTSSSEMEEESRESEEDSGGMVEP